MSLQDILDENNVEYRIAGQHHHATTRFAQVDCPWCSPDSGKFRLGLALTGTHATCWVCGSRYIVDAVAQLTGLKHADVKKLLGDISYAGPSEKVKRGKLVIPHGVGPLWPAHIKYLKGRGFDPDELVRLWDIGGIGPELDLAWRIFMPVKQYGETVSWTTRSISDEGTRYHSARPDQEAVALKELLYGMDYCRHAIIVVEGPTSMYAIGPGASATCGIGYSQAQLLAISRFPVRATCFDNQPDAQKRARQLCNDLSVYPGETKNVILSYKDPAVVMQKAPNEIKELRKMFLE